MTDEKMIEEMAKDLKTIMIKQHIGIRTSLEDSYQTHYAEAIVKAGYRKISKGSVVLTDEEYSDYLILQQNHEFIREKAKKLQEDNERLYKNIGKFKDIVRKETAVSIIEEILHCKQDRYFYMVDMLKIRALLHKYGVEVEE